MYDVSDFKGKAILACAASLGWEVSDFLALDRTLVEQHLKRAEEEKQQYVYFQTTRSKTHVPRLAVLNPLAVEALKNWLPLNPTARLFDMTKSGISKFMQSTAKKANLTTTGSIRFHRVRAWVFNSLLKAGFSDSEAKYIVGKAIPHSDGTYLRLREGIEQKYPRFYNEHLNIKPQRVMIPEDVKRENEDLKQRISQTEQKLADLENLLRKTLGELRT
jgi:integrase